MRFGRLFLWLISVATATTARAQTAHYLVIYAASSQAGGIARDSHDFAAFVAAPAGSLEAEDWYRQGPDEALIISWLPAVMPICITCTEGQAGRNYGLRETIELEHQASLRVSQWGPYEIKPELYAMAQQQMRRLGSGRVHYLLWDKGQRPWDINCIHAVTDLDTTRPRLETGAQLGDVAGVAIVHFFAPYLLRQVGDLGPRLSQWLGVQDLPIQSRTPD